uniref:Uncharacterized protein n=1 Tax=Candidatus Kentrum sp. UNK TaxID=2126344 RepID=A0A450ZXI4_9GAMM|nr:MAG: hypothetical protein BECKUNK1418G_GA0071005_100336 [Candidatus Kentron sp. UNK]VFK68893.1 MAG: hypothetical protein BECKUNK1418H_GA0071006_100738 [Candidatus Kentron sp. UNK]
MIMKNSNYVAGYPGIGILIRHACRRQNDITHQDCHGNTERTWKSISYAPISYKSRLWRIIGRSPVFVSTSVIRKIFVAVGALLLSACATTSPPSNFTLWPNLSLSNSSLSEPSIPLENSPPETGYTENTFDVDVEQKYGGGKGIFNVAKAYLDYTFFSRRTENLHQDFQGRLGITNKITHADYRDTPKLRGSFIEDSPLPFLGRFPANSLDTWSHNDPEYQGNNSFTASVEWRLNAPGFADKPAFDNLTWGDVLQVSFFADYGKAFSNATALIDTREQELGIGTGLRFLLPGRFTANFQAAYPIDSWEREGSMTDREGDSSVDRTRFWLDFSYNF